LKEPVGLDDEPLGLDTDQFVAVGQERNGSLQHRRDRDDLGSENLEAFRHVLDAAGDGLRARMAQAFDQLQDDLFVFADLAEHQDDLKENF